MGILRVPVATVQVEKCGACGHPATAVWQGAGTISICSTCAVEVLPALAADALAARIDDYDDARRSIRDIEARYWRAIAALALRRGGR